MDAIISEARGLADLGKYDEATSKLRLGHSQTADEAERLHIVYELATVLKRQGYWKDALHTIQSELGNTPPQSKEYSIYLQLEMNALLLRPAVTGSFKGILDEAESVFGRFLELHRVGTIAEFDAAWIQIKISYSNLIALISDFHQPSERDGTEATLGWVCPTIETLIESHREREAFQVAENYVGLKSLRIAPAAPHGVKYWSNLMECIINSPTATPLLKAKAMSLLVEHSEDLDRDGLDNLAAKAIQIFEEEGHVHGAMDVKIQQARMGLKEDYRYLTEELAQELKGYFASYEEGNALAPYQRAVEAILSHIQPWQGFEFRIALSNIRDELIKMAGAQLDFYLNQIRLLGTWLTHSGRSARVIESAEALDALVDEEDCRWVSGMVANIIAQAYAQLDDFDKSYAWATKAATTWGSLFPSDQAEATRTALQARLQAFQALKGVDTTDIIAFAESNIEVNLAQGLLGQAVQTMELIVSQILSPRKDPRQEQWLDRMEKHARKLSETMPEEGDVRTAAICQNRGLARLNTGQGVQDTANEEACIAYLEEAVALYTKHQRLVEAASTRQMHALALYSVFQKTGASATLERCVEIISIARDAFRALENTKFISTSTRWYSFYLYIAWLRQWTTGPVVLQALREAEEAWADERTDMTVFAALEAVRRRQHLTSAVELRDTYKRAFHICLQEGRAVDMWDWVQRAKARSLSDQLGAGVLLPATLRETVMDDPSMKELIRKEEELTQCIAASEAAVRLKLRGELHITHRLMAEQPALKAILDLMRGTPVTLDQILEFGRETKQKLPRDIAFVDWVDVGGNFWALILKTDSQPQLVSCGIRADTIAAWKRQWLDAQPGTSPNFEDEEFEECDKEFSLRRLDQLVAPLRHLTDKGDLLVFLPTGVLHSIPLHALFVSDRTPVILRNPVVYSASLTTFWQCCRRVESAPPSALPWTMAGVFEPAAGRPFYPTERQAVYEAMRQLAEKHGGTAVSGEAVTKARFKDTIQASALYLFHGHCLLDRAALADQSLELADGLFLVHDVFDLKLPSPHITLVACDSASQGIAAGDEPLGLVTALLCAGAGSVTGTIWPTASGTGRRFAAEFYKELEAERLAMVPTGGAGGTIINLAVSVQRAVLALRRRRETRQPYHWAAFVLHGSWSIYSSGRSRQNSASALDEPGGPQAAS
ncbi:hypothetical protein DL767_003687 [Monosporascus sp. MG133]|nr:hypothetical protein DL767_003687 [Monosporascus sp. MG133]